GRSSGGDPRWWSQDVDPTKFVLPGPLHEPQRYVARYFLYPWWLRREAKRAQLVHILDHSYAHMVTRVHRRPAVVTVHDLMPVIILRSPTDGWREGVRNRFLRGTLKALRLAGAYIVGTEWLKRELATWLGDDRRISVVPFGVDRAFFSESPNARIRGRADWRIPDEAFVVLHVGSTVERKNVPLVINTVARLRSEADAYLLQVGGRLTGDQEQLIERLGLRRFVRTAPFADESTLPLAGYAARRGPSRGVADPLELNALLLRAPGQSVAILTADLLFVTAELKARLLEAVGAKLGLDEASLLVAASHTHTAPAVDASKPRLGVCDAAYADVVAGRATELLGQLASIDPVPCH